MPHKIIMPQLGQTVENCTIVSWLKQEGDLVEKGDILMEIETDKTVLEVESFRAGTLLKILVPQDAAARVGSTVAYIGEPGESIPKADESEGASIVMQKPDKRSETAATDKPDSFLPTDRLKISPRARKFAEGKGVDLSLVTGSGVGGRITEKDIQDFLESDTQQSLQNNMQGQNTQPMTTMRKVIAARLSESFSTIPHFYVTSCVDMTSLIAYRKDLKTRGNPYSISDFILCAVAQSLKELPVVNSTTDGLNFTTPASINLGLAVSMENGLAVPVLHQADKKSIQELHVHAKALAEKAREGKLHPEDMQGGTFTISNMGMLGVENFSAIINPGEGAILAVASSKETPVVFKGEITVRDLMKMTISADHRLIDGALAAKFLNVVKEKLEDANWARQLCKHTDPALPG